MCYENVLHPFGSLVVGSVAANKWLRISSLCSIPFSLWASLFGHRCRWLKASTRCTLLYAAMPNGLSASTMPIAGKTHSITATAARMATRSAGILIPTTCHSFGNAAFSQSSFRFRIRFGFNLNSSYRKDAAPCNEK